MLILSLSKFKSIVFSLLLAGFFVLISLGNLTRLLGGAFGGNNIVITELFLFVFSFVSLVLFLKIPKGLFVFSFLVVLSTAIGSLVNPFSFTPTLYAFRLIGLGMSGVAIGKVLFDRYKEDYLACFSFLVRAYVVNIALGFLIYFLFPRSYELWVFLRRFGIVFLGDPHVGRFISPYFDPNYFSAICCIPLILHMHRGREAALSRQNRFFNYLISLVFVLSIILTWSRSGMATACFVLTYLFAGRLKERFIRVKVSSICFVAGALIVLAVVFPFITKDFFYFVGRVANMRTDESALGRLFSFAFGLFLLNDSPLFGCGYHYLSEKMADYCSLSSIDSSVLSTFIDFGLLIGACFAFFYVLFVSVVRTSLRKVMNTDQNLYSVVKAVLFYVNICVLFTSLFNNLLYYPFWLVPVIALMVYLNGCVRDCPKTRFSCSR